MKPKPSLTYQEHPGFRGSTHIEIFRNEIPQQPAEFAMQLMKQLAIATGVKDGLDAAGRDSYRLLTPAEIVKRATDIAELTWQEFRRRDWLLDLPVPKPPTEAKTNPTTP